MNEMILNFYSQPSKEGLWKKGAHCIYRIYFHLVLFTPKGRPIINSEIANELGCIFRTHAVTKGQELFGYVIHPNHAHLLLGVKPTHYMPKIAKEIRERSSFLILRRHKDIQKKDKVTKLWSGRFAIETLGDFSMERIKNPLQDLAEHSVLEGWEDS